MAKKRNKPGSYKRIKKELIAEQQHICYYCKSEVFKEVIDQHPKRLTIDHFIPISAGGAITFKGNMRISCNHCNISKKDSIVTEEQVERGELPWLM